MSDAKVQEELSDELDRLLLKGMKTISATIDAGDDLRGAAAFANVARQRTKDCGISKVVAPGSDLARLASEIGKAKFNTVNLRELNDEPDEATDGIERAAAE